MNKYFEPFMWAICAIAIIALILTDPIAVAFLLDNILVICLWGMSVTVCGTVGFIAGHCKGNRHGYSIGYTNGWNHGRGEY